MLPKSGMTTSSLDETLFFFKFKLLTSGNNTDTDFSLVMFTLESY